MTLNEDNILLDYRFMPLEQFTLIFVAVSTPSTCYFLYLVSAPFGMDLNKRNTVLLLKAQKALAQATISS
jgi:hypothetical protein